MTSELQRAQESVANLRDVARQHHLSRAKISSKILKYPHIDDYAVRTPAFLLMVYPLIWLQCRLLFGNMTRDNFTMLDAHCTTFEPCTPCSPTSSTRTLQRYVRRMLHPIPTAAEPFLPSRSGFPRVTTLRRCIEHSSIEATTVNPPHSISSLMTYWYLPIFGKGNFSIAVCSFWLICGMQYVACNVYYDTE